MPQLAEPEVDEKNRLQSLHVKIETAPSSSEYVSTMHATGRAATFSQ